MSVLGSGLRLGSGSVPGSGPVSGPGSVSVLGSGSTSAESWKDFLPYILLVKADGGTDHNIKHLYNLLSMLALFLLRDMDPLVAIRGCPGLSFQNISQRAMYLLKPGLSNLALKIDEDAPDWLIDLLDGVSTMKAVRYEIELYDKEVLKAVKYFERTKQHSEPMTRNNNAESGANIIADTTLAVAVSKNNEATTDTDSEDEFLADITTAK